MVSNPF